MASSGHATSNHATITSSLYASSSLVAKKAVALRSYDRWCNDLPMVLLDLVGHYLNVNERLLIIERTCVTWYHASASHGIGWTAASAVHVASSSPSSTTPATATTATTTTTLAFASYAMVRLFQDEEDHSYDDDDTGCTNGYQSTDRIYPLMGFAAMYNRLNHYRQPQQPQQHDDGKQNESKAGDGDVAQEGKRLAKLTRVHRLINAHIVSKRDINALFAHTMDRVDERYSLSPSQYATAYERYSLARYVTDDISPQFQSLMSLSLIVYASTTYLLEPLALLSQLQDLSIIMQNESIEARNIRRDTTRRHWSGHSRGVFAIKIPDIPSLISLRVTSARAELPSTAASNHDNDDDDDDDNQQLQVVFAATKLSRLHRLEIGSSLITLCRYTCLSRDLALQRVTDGDDRDPYDAMRRTDPWHAPQLTTLILRRGLYGAGSYHDHDEGDDSWYYHIVPYIPQLHHLEVNQITAQQLESLLIHVPPDDNDGDGEGDDHCVSSNYPVYRLVATQLTTLVLHDLDGGQYSMADARFAAQFHMLATITSLTHLELHDNGDEIAVNGCDDDRDLDHHDTNGDGSGDDDQHEGGENQGDDDEEKGNKVGMDRMLANWSEMLSSLVHLRSLCITTARSNPARCLIHRSLHQYLSQRTSSSSSSANRTSSAAALATINGIPLMDWLAMGRS